MKKFVTALNCMDGRVQEPVISYLKSKYNADYVDMITEPGTVKFLAGQDDGYKMNSIKERIGISMGKHHSEHIFIIAHDDCAGNPVEPETHQEQVRKAVKNLRGFYPGCRVTGIWVDRQWTVHELDV